VAMVLTLDRYLRNRRPDDGPDFALQPAFIDWPLVYAHIDSRWRGQHVATPEYDLEAGRRLPGRIPQIGQLTFLPTDILIIRRPALPSR
jgi:uridine kinase